MRMNLGPSPDPAQHGMGDGQAPFNANAQTLDDLIGSSAGLAEVSAGIAQNQAQAEQDEADRLFGATIRQAIEAAHGASVALIVVHAFCNPTRPATPARALQDRVHSVISARLDKIAAEVGK